MLTPSKLCVSERGMIGGGGRTRKGTRERVREKRVQSFWATKFWRERGAEGGRSQGPRGDCKLAGTASTNTAPPGPLSRYHVPQSQVII